MIMDDLLEFATDGSLGTATGTVLVGDVVDLGSEPQDFGNGRPMYMYVQITDAVTGTGISVQFQIATDSLAAVATDGTATEHLLTPDFPSAELVAGWNFCAPLSVGHNDNPYERYLGLLAFIQGTSIGAGSITAGLTFGPRGWRSYSDAVN